MVYNQATALQVRLNLDLIIKLTRCPDILQSVALRIPARAQSREAQSQTGQTKERTANKSRADTACYPTSATVLAWSAFRREYAEASRDGEA
jgi:hypothetical protein